MDTSERLFGDSEPTLFLPAWLDAVFTNGVIGVVLTSEFRAWTDYLPRIRERLGQVKDLNVEVTSGLEGELKAGSGYTYKIHPHGFVVGFAYPVVMEGAGAPAGPSFGLSRPVLRFSSMLGALVTEARGLAKALLETSPERDLVRIGVVSRADFPHADGPPGYQELARRHQSAWGGREVPEFNARAVVRLADEKTTRDQCIHTFNFDARKIEKARQTTFQADWQRLFKNPSLRRPADVQAAISTAAAAAYEYFDALGKGLPVAKPNPSN